MSTNDTSQWSTNILSLSNCNLHFIFGHPRPYIKITNKKLIANCLLFSLIIGDSGLIVAQELIDDCPHLTIAKSKQLLIVSTSSDPLTNKLVTLFLFLSTQLSHFFYAS